MKETKTIAHIQQLETPDWSIQHDHWPETAHYLWFFSYEGNQYVDPNLVKLCQKWVNAFNDLESSAVKYFYTEGDRYVFMPAGYDHYIHRTDEEQPEYKKAFSELASLAQKALKAYIKYREVIRLTLYV